MDELKGVMVGETKGQNAPNKYFENIYRKGMIFFTFFDL